MKVCPSCWVLFPDEAPACPKCAPIKKPKPEKQKVQVSDRPLSFWKWLTLASVLMTVAKGIAYVAFPASSVPPSAYGPQVTPENSRSSSSRGDSASSFVAPEELSAQQAFKVSPFKSVVLLQTAWFWGSSKVTSLVGTVVSKDGLILTLSKPFEPAGFESTAGSISVCVNDDVSKSPTCGYSAKVLMRNTKLNLALLQADKPLDGLVPVRLYGLPTSVASMTRVGIAWYQYDSNGFGFVASSGKAFMNGNKDAYDLDFPLRNGYDWGTLFDANGVFVWIARPSAASNSILASWVSASAIAGWLDQFATKWPGKYSVSDFTSKSKMPEGTVIDVSPTERPELAAELEWLKTPGHVPSETVSRGLAFLKSAPDSFEANFAVAKAYVLAWEIQKSLGYFEKAAMFSNGNPKVGIAYADVLIKTWRSSEALQILTSAQSQKLDGASMADSYVVEASAYESLNRPMDRLVAFKRALLSDSNNAAAKSGYESMIFPKLPAFSPEDDEACKKKSWAYARATWLKDSKSQPICECQPWSRQAEKVLYCYENRSASITQEESLKFIQYYVHDHFSWRNRSFKSSDCGALQKDYAVFEPVRGGFSEAAVPNSIVDVIHSYYTKDAILTCNKR